VLHALLQTCFIYLIWTKNGFLSVTGWKTRGHNLTRLYRGLQNIRFRDFISADLRATRIFRQETDGYDSAALFIWRRYLDCLHHIQTTKQTPWPVVSKRTIPTDRQPLVGEI
jgi:hypothetical protein